MRRRPVLPLLLIAFSLPSLLLAQSGASAASADTSQRDRLENVRDRLENVNVSIQIESDSSPKTGSAPKLRRYEILATADGSSSKLTTGSRIPIPITTSSTPGTSEPVTRSIQYQDIGFSADVTVRVLGKDRFVVDARIEDSILQDAKEDGSYPVVQHHTYQVRGALALGETLLVSSNSSKKYYVTLGVGEGGSGG